MEPWAVAKKLSVSVAVPPAPVRVPSQRPLASSVASVSQSIANDKEMILEAVHRSAGICLTAEEKPRKSQLGDRVMKGLCNQSSPFIQMRSVGSHSTSGRKEEGKKEGRGFRSRIHVRLAMNVSNINLKLDIEKIKYLALYIQNFSSELMVSVKQFTYSGKLPNVCIRF